MIEEEEREINERSAFLFMSFLRRRKDVINVLNDFYCGDFNQAYSFSSI